MKILIATFFIIAPLVSVASEITARGANCMACHAVDRRLVGPSFKDISARYSNDPLAVERLSTKIRNGGVGNWGAIPMPGNNTLTDAQVRALAEWSISFK